MAKDIKIHSRNVEKYNDLSTLLTLRKIAGVKITDKSASAILGIGPSTLQRWEEEYNKSNDNTNGKVSKEDAQNQIRHIQIKYALRHILDNENPKFLKTFCDIIEAGRLPALDPQKLEELPQLVVQKINTSAQRVGLRTTDLFSEFVNRARQVLPL